MQALKQSLKSKSTESSSVSSLAYYCTSPALISLTNDSFSKLAFIQLPVFAVFLRYKYFNTAYTRTSLRELSANIDRLVNPLPPAARDIWIKIRDGISYYGTRPLVAGEGVPGANATGPQGGSATGAQRSTSGATQRGI